MSTNNSFPKIPSPCINDCCLNEHDICLGCWRSLSEIKQWSVVNDDIRQKILNNAEKRKQYEAIPS